ncbi:hypothetical protein [Spiroplasma endosymbiont of Polydrusus pterygomalis]|uniref:hypothetical protein n=1 Tax=Spiroplasma endosymbiont of Polydrusus pterygomalis TaxID=3139327 RepID=UPI003CCAAFED
MGNLQDKTAYYAKMLEHSVLSPNEVRNQEGYESVEGLDIYGMTKNSDWQEHEKISWIILALTSIIQLIY